MSKKHQRKVSRSQEVRPLPPAASLHAPPLTDLTLHQLAKERCLQVYLVMILHGGIPPISKSLSHESERIHVGQKNSMMSIIKGNNSALYSIRTHYLNSKCKTQFTSTYIISPFRSLLGELGRGNTLFYSERPSPSVFTCPL